MFTVCWKVKAINVRNNKGYGFHVPPDYKDVEIYFLANHSSLEAAKSFYEYYASGNWINRRGHLIKNWKVLAWQWIYYKSSFRQGGKLKKEK